MIDKVPPSSIPDADGGAPKSRLSPAQLAKINEEAQQFEGMFMAQMLEFMWKGIETNDYFGGGAGEETWRHFMIEEYGNISAKSGSLGIADAVRAELIKAQEKTLPADPISNTVPTGDM
jgi:Rod binding domain-containing protein